MKRLFKPRHFLAVLFVGTVWLFGGCASASSIPTSSPTVARRSSDYVYVMLEGSNVPVLMLKSQAVTNYPGVNQSDVSYLSPVAFHELINRLSVGTPH